MKKVNQQYEQDKQYRICKTTCKTTLAFLVGMICAVPAFADGNVTIWGSIDSGISYVSNAGGKHVVMMDDGVDGPDLLGIRGSEDLGGGTRATFELVNQFHIDDGSFMPGQSLFSRTSTIGLTNPRWGTLRIGNQYDYMTDGLFFEGGAGMAEIPGHFYGFRAGPFQKLDLPDNPTGAFDWDRMSGEVVSNSVKYNTPVFKGFSGGAMYAFGNVPGSVGAGNGSSFALNYAAKNFGINAAYTNLKYYTAGSPQVSIRNWGVGAHYDVGKWNFFGLVTTVHNSLNGASVYEGSVWANYHFTPALSASLSYMYMKGNAVVDDNHAHELSANVLYAFSKRTEVYVMGLWQKANSGSQAQIVTGLNSPDGASTSDSQAVVRVGIRHRF